VASHAGIRGTSRSASTGGKDSPDISQVFVHTRVSWSVGISSAISMTLVWAPQRGDAREPSRRRHLGSRIVLPSSRIGSGGLRKKPTRRRGSSQAGCVRRSKKYPRPIGCSESASAAPRCHRWSVSARRAGDPGGAYRRRSAPDRSRTTSGVPPRHSRVRKGSERLRALQALSRCA